MFENVEWYTKTRWGTQMVHSEEVSFTVCWEFMKEQNCEFHHTSLIREYVSRKVAYGFIRPYKGRFGEGFVLLRPNWGSTNYSYITYYIKRK